MNQYEMTYIRKIGLDQDTINKIEARISRAFERQEGELLGTLDLGEKILAYMIQKEARGHYFQLNFLGSGPLIDELETLFRISPEILRFLTIRLARNVDPEQKKKEYAEKKTAKPREEFQTEDIATS